MTMNSQQKSQYSIPTEKNWVVRHINWTYGLVLLVALIIGTWLALTGHWVVGLITYLVIVIISSPAVLAVKGIKAPWWIYLLFVLSTGLGFPIAVLCLRSKEKQG
jgi:hypothetical protein